MILNLSNEEWKAINGYEGLYEVSNKGRVKALEKYMDNSKGRRSFIKEKLLSDTNINNAGYKRVGLTKDKVYKGYMIHRLVAEAFIPNPNNLPIINHKDEDKLNNNVENLEWCDTKYNNCYNDRQIRIGKKNSIPIIQCDRKGNIIKEWESIREASRAFQVDGREICKALKGKKEFYCGYKWVYKELQKNVG